MTVKLYGYVHSVYSWIARFALHEKGVGYEWVEVNPFADDICPDYLAMNPFRRVPTLLHGDFVLFETIAITRYIDEAFRGPSLLPPTAQDKARVSQIVSVVDSYLYRPLVRQVFTHGIFRPHMGLSSDVSEYQRGLEAAPRILAALDRLTQGSQFLISDALSLADIHLAPMMAYFTCDPEGKAFLNSCDRLSAWWRSISRREGLAETRPPILKDLEL